MTVGTNIRTFFPSHYKLKTDQNVGSDRTETSEWAFPKFQFLPRFRIRRERKKEGGGECTFFPEVHLKSCKERCRPFSGNKCLPAVSTSSLSVRGKRNEISKQPPVLVFINVDLSSNNKFCGCKTILAYWLLKRHSSSEQN